MAVYRHTKKENAMKNNIVKVILPLTPVIVLFITLFFLNHAVQHFKDTAYTFVFDTNKESLMRFSRELEELSANGYTSAKYGDLYTNMIGSYNSTLGDKYAIVSFLVDEQGQIHHSNGPNQTYLQQALQDTENTKLISAAAASKSDGETELTRSGDKELFYYRHYYSGDDDYCLFMTVDRQAIEAQLTVDGVIIPISAVGLLLFLMMEYTIWLKKAGEKHEVNAENDNAAEDRAGDDHAD
jgi:hypothetical protein